MAISCVVCGEWVQSLGSDRLDICTPCLTLNFAATQASEAPRDPPQGPVTRETLPEFVDSQGPYTLTPRQAQAMSRLVEAWRRQEEP
jgi:hypothetical protein